MAVDYTESFTLLGIGLFFILVRVYVRWTQVGPSNFQLDDYMMPLAGVCRSPLYSSFLGLRF